MSQSWDYIKVNFWLFSNLEMNFTIRQNRKSSGKNGVISLVTMFHSWVMVLELSKKCIFCKFVQTSARNPNLSKQFTYMHLKVFVTCFQKMVLFIMLWLPVFEILGFKNKEFCILISYISWAVTQTPINHIILWDCNENFQMHICGLL